MTKKLIDDARQRAAIGCDVDPIDAARLLNELADELESALAREFGMKLAQRGDGELLRVQRERIGALEAMAARLDSPENLEDEHCVGCGRSGDDGHEDCVVRFRMTRAAVPDAATELRAERDAALAAIERVRANHQIDDYTAGRTIVRCVCEEIWPCQTIRALDGAPEPEWEYVGQAYEASGFMRIQNDQLTPEKFDSWRKLMAQYPRVEILKRVKAVPAGPWLPVEGERP